MLINQEIAYYSHLYLESFARKKRIEKLRDVAASACIYLSRKGYVARICYVPDKGCLKKKHKLSSCLLRALTEYSKRAPLL